MTTLEQRYRRLIGFLPKAYREARAEEMLTTLLDGARPGQRRPTIADAVSVGSLAVRLRFGAPGASARGRRTGEIARKAILVNLIYQSSGTVFVLFHDFRPWRSAHPVVSDPGFYVSVLCLTEVALVVSLLFGWRRVSHVLVVAALLALAVQGDRELRFDPIYAHFFGAAAAYIPTFAFLALQSITILLAAPAFHRDAPPLRGRGWWLLAWVPLIVPELFTDTPDTSFTAAAGVVGAALAATRVRSSPVWPIAFLLAAWPMLLDGINTSVSGELFTPQSQTEVVETFSTVGVLLVLTLMSLGYRQRRIVRA